MEMDIIEVNGNCWMSTVWHTNPDMNGGCDQWGCFAETAINNKFSVRAEFSNDGFMTTYVNGEELSGLRPYPSADEVGIVKETMASVGVALWSSQWYGWAPGEQYCPGYADQLDNSVFTISNLKVQGTWLQGVHPTICGEDPTIDDDNTSGDDSGDDCNIGDSFILQAVSKGFSDGNEASLTSSDGFDDSWTGRGFNVISFSDITNTLLSQQTFDTYSSEVESNSMLSFLTAVPSGSLVVILAMDAVDHWSGNKNIGNNLKTYMSSEFGATQFSSLTFRESYGLIGYKGESSPLAEDVKIAGSGSVTLSVIVPCFVGGPTISPVFHPSSTPMEDPVPAPTTSPVLHPTPSPIGQPAPPPFPGMC